MRFCELQEKEVINTCDCKKLGCIIDLIFDECNGKIEAIVNHCRVEDSAVVAVPKVQQLWVTPR